MLRCSDEAEEGAPMKEMLDAIDKVRASLGALKDNQTFYEEVLSSLPQFVVCGPQSAGKSSVIRRVSGIALPEASTLCTRMATLIQLRRCHDTSVKVTLVGPAGEEHMEEVCGTPERVRDAVSKAQDLALARSPGKAFVDDHVIQVYVSGPTKANVTLVDLPGFHTADDQGTKMVNQMVQRYIGMPGTLVLHVIKGDQDYASMLGNDFMRQASRHDGNRVTVLTHCDKLSPSTSDDAQRLRATLDTTADISTCTFAVHGSATDDGEEESTLQHLAGMDTRVEVGSSLLSAHLEERMRAHLELQYPKALEKLQKSLDDTHARLETIRERAPAEVVFVMARLIEDEFRAKKQALMNDLRTILEKMTSDVKNFELRPITNKGAPLYIRKRDEFDEPLESRKKVYFSSSVGGLNKPYFVKAISGKKVILEDSSGEESSLSDSAALYSAEVIDFGKMEEDIQILIADRGLRNSIHADRQPIIACYANTFAEYYTTVINEAAGIMAARISTLFDAIFASEQIPESAMPAAARLRLRLRSGETEVAHLANLAIASLKAHNMEADLIFTPNEHYLSQLIQDMVKADSSMASDNGGARHIFHNVRAYIKVQKKVISEMAAKEMVRTLLKGNEANFHNLLASEVAELAEFIKEPHRIARERASLLNRKQVLENALKQAPPSWSRTRTMTGAASK